MLTGERCVLPRSKSSSSLSSCLAGTAFWYPLNTPQSHHLGVLAACAYPDQLFPALLPVPVGRQAAKLSSHAVRTSKRDANENPAMDLCKDCRILWAQVLLEARTGSTDTRVGASVDGAWLNARGCPLCNYIHLGVAEALSQQRHLSEADCYVRFYLHVDDASRLAAIELVVINDDETWVMDPIKMTVWASQGTLLPPLRFYGGHEESLTNSP